MEDVEEAIFRSYFVAARGHENLDTIQYELLVNSFSDSFLFKHSIKGGKSRTATLDIGPLGRVSLLVFG